MIFLLTVFGKIYSAPGKPNENEKMEINNFFEKNVIVDALNDMGVTKYYYSQNLSDAQKIQRKMPLFNFTECFNMIKDHNDNIKDIYVILMEFNNQKYVNEQYQFLTRPISPTTFQFFTQNFEYEGFLDYSICNNMEIEVSKSVDTVKMDFQKIKDIEQKYNISVYKNETNFRDYCTPLNINNKDLTVYDRQIFLFNNAMPCDNGCTFVNFDYATNYSTCLCKMHYEDEDINLLNEISEKFKENELIEKFIKLKEKGNWKYFKCYKQAFVLQNKNEKHNWIRYISMLLLLIVLALQILHYISVQALITSDKNESKKEEESTVNSLKNLKNSNNSLNKIFTLSTKNENDKNDKSDGHTIDINQTYTISINNENDKNDKSDGVNEADGVSSPVEQASAPQNRGHNNSICSSNNIDIYILDDKNNVSEDIKKKNIKNSNTRHNNLIIQNQDEFDDSEHDDNDNENEDIKNKNVKNVKNQNYDTTDMNNGIKINNFFINTNQEKIDNLDGKDNNCEDIKSNNLDTKNNYNILSSENEIVISDGKNDNSEDKKDKNNLTFGGRKKSHYLMANLILEQIENS